MKKHKKLAIPILTILFVFVISALMLFRNSEFWPQQAPSLTLPFPIDNPPTGIEPMGETVNHAMVPGGHPGIDFQWEGKVELPAAMAGKVSSIYETNEHGYHEWNVDIQNGKYVTRYKELVDYNRDLQVGSPVEIGDYIGTVGSNREEIVSRQLHWEFGYSKIITSEFDRMCPTPFLDDADAELLENIWQNANYNHRDQFPDICSGPYNNF